jgi:hypothetical protein
VFLVSRRSNPPQTNAPQTVTESYDRVRECFRILLRGLELCDDEDDIPAGESTVARSRC